LLWPSTLTAKRLSAIRDLRVNLLDLIVQLLDHFQGLLDRSRVPSLTLPASDSLTFRLTLAKLGVYLLAILALAWLLLRLVDKLHATGFTHAILPVAVLAEVTPLPIATSETVLLEEAHCLFGI